MKQKVLNYINENLMIKENDKVLVALSGGPDSICLLHILNSLKEELKIKLYAAHINHCFRGEESDGDEEYVKEFCEKLEIPCYVLKTDVSQIAKKKKISSEMAGRDVRYGFFRKIVREHKLDKIAIAHNLNDQAETVLMRMMRGTGIEGLSGIRPVREKIYIRPILCLNRDEIENYCEVNELFPRIDKTNLQNIYSRNKVRLDIIPYIKEHFNEDIVSALNRLSQLAYTDSEYINSVAKERYMEFCSLKEFEVTISKEAFKEHKSIISRVLKIAYIEIAKSAYNLEMKHIDDLILLQRGETNKELHLPNDVKAKNIYGDLRIYRQNKGDVESGTQTQELNISKKDIMGKYFKIFKSGNKEYTINFEIIMNKSVHFDNNSLIKYFDYDKIIEGIGVRTRKDGDRITPLGMKGSKKVKDIFIDLKIPKEKRSSIPMVCFDKKIAWIVGIKASEEFKVNNLTKNILKITVIERNA